MSQQVIKVGVFYDGSYFHHVNRYYSYHSDIQAPIAYGGIRSFVTEKIASLSAVAHDELVQVIDTVLVRGRYSASEAKQRESLFGERVMDEVLMYNQIRPIYQPLSNVDGRKKERGTSITLALEALELAYIKKYDYVVLIAGHSDYCQLINKLHAAGVKTVLLFWDIEYNDSEGAKRFTKTSLDLIDSACFAVRMEAQIEEMSDDELNNIFSREKERTS